ncbi:MAG: acyltransferase domain-containing protein, partial [Actinobacteria bacterium]|nr:acyltransferase domain-containing protein [Actinomycetota bacterium]
MLAIVAPGQGAQTPAMLQAWLELPGVSEQLTELSVASGVDLLTHGTLSDADTIRDTAVAQPLIVAAGLVSWQALNSPAADVFAGHSVGEITAAVMAGVLSPSNAMSFVQLRGSEMASAAKLVATGMSAVLGGEASVVVAKAELHGLTPANMNGAGQIVVAGTLQQLDAFAADPPEGSRVRPLAVAGAFHTVHMSPALFALDAFSSSMVAHDPTAPLLSNADGSAVDTGAETLRRLVAQVSNPVRWDLCMDMMVSMGVTGLIELSPGGTLVGLAKRAMPGIATVAVKSPEDLDAAFALIAEHGG